MLYDTIEMQQRNSFPDIRLIQGKGVFVEKGKDNFIMLPVVDFCFKELLQNGKVRLGLTAALLGRRRFRIPF